MTRVQAAPPSCRIKDAGPAPKIAFLIRALTVGGAERQLVTLAQGLHRRGHSVLVIVFYPGGVLYEELVQSGVRVRSLEKRGRWDTGGFLLRLLKLIREEAPDVLHSYLEVSNLLTGALKPVFPRVRMVWGIRASDIDYSRYDWLTRFNVWLQRGFARLPDLILVNSSAGLAHHRALGFPPGRMRVIPNGIDTERFHPDPEAGRAIRAEWGMADDDRVVGVVGRLDPVKDHPTLLRAVARLGGEYQHVRFVCLGDGFAEYRTQMLGLALKLGVEGRVRWLPARRDMPAVYNAFDLVCSSSSSEGFPNVLAEAMACGIPCVATDVGDSAWIVADTGVIVPPRDPDALTRGLVEALANRTRKPDPAARHRVISMFSTENLVHATEAALWAKD